MAGATLTLDSRSVEAALGRLLAQVQQPKAVLEDIGTYLLTSHDERWDRQQSPDGTPWQPLAPRTARRKPAQRQILEQELLLRQTLTWQVSGGELRFGTAQPYGATHQFGDASRNIPARPWLGLSAEDEGEVEQQLAAALRRAVGG